MYVNFTVDDKWDEWTEAIKHMANEFPEDTKKFINEQTRLARLDFKKYYDENHNDSGEMAKSWKRGRAKIKANTLSGEVYSYDPVLHLVEDGHDLVLGGPKPPKYKVIVDKNGVTRTKSGRVVGFVKAYKPFETVSTIVSEDFLSKSDKFLSDLLGIYNL